MKQMIRLMMSGEPIRKRTDPRYLAKLAVKEVAHKIVTSIPEYATITLAFVVMMIAIPCIFSIIG